VLVSLAVHAVVIATWRVGGELPQPIPRDHVILLAPPQSSPGVPAVDMRYAPRTGPAPALPVPAAPARQPEGPPEAAPGRVSAGEKPSPPPGGVAVRDTTPPVAGYRRVGPAYADGRLWVRALPLAPKDLAERLDRSHGELMDSAVTVVVQAFLDSIAASPEGRKAELPSWTTEIAGKTFGLDSRYLHIAGLRIPAAVLALLPIPAAGNQQEALQHGMDLRADLMRAAQRAQTTDEFKEQIREIRDRKEAEREFEKAQREAPPPRDPPTP
ncbi:MAG: hypothetical protein ACREL6_00630, partial [Gemmatimonadales bacterium]